MLHQMGLHAETLGDSTGKLAQLMYSTLMACLWHPAILTGFAGC